MSGAKGDLSGFPFGRGFGFSFDSSIAGPATERGLGRATEHGARILATSAGSDVLVTIQTLKRGPSHFYRLRLGPEDQRRLLAALAPELDTEEQAGLGPA